MSPPQFHLLAGSPFARSLIAYIYVRRGEDA